MLSRKLRNIPLVGPFRRKLATGSDVIFPGAFFLEVAHNGSWGVLYDVRVYSFPWLSAPFIFIIHIKFVVFRYVVQYSKDRIYKSHMNDMCDIWWWWRWRRRREVGGGVLFECNHD